MENEDQFHKQQGRGPFSQEVTTKIETQFQCRHCRKAVDYEFFNTGGFSAEFYGWTAKTANIGIAIRQVPLSTIVPGLEIRFKNQVTTCSDFPSDAF